MIYLYAFLIGGLLCGIAQLIIDLFKVTTGHATAIFVCAGALLEFGDVYDRLIEFAGAGALLPITSFGHSLADGSYNKALEVGYIGILTGMYEKASGGIAFAIIISIIIALIFKPKD